MTQNPRQADPFTVPMPQSMTVSELVQTLRTDPETGLTEKNARARRKRIGSNHIRNEMEIRFSTSLKAQFKGFSNLFFLLTMFLFYLFEQETVYLIGLFLSLGLMLLGAAAESSAARLMKMPGKYAALSVRVIRDGRLQVVDSRTLVPGDVVFLEKGNLVPADARILEDDGELTALETPVSGLRNRVRKSHRAMGEETEAVATNMVYAGTIITSGSCRVLVCRTGKQTLTRQIHVRKDTYLPSLLKRVQKLCNLTSLLSLAMCPVLILTGALRGADVQTVFLLAVLASASTLCDSALSLAYIAFGRGVRDMAKDRLIVRNPDRVARLAQVNTIQCSKQQTFPPKRIRLSAVYAGKLCFASDGATPAMQSVLKLALVCSDHPSSRMPYEQVIHQYLKDACADLSDLTGTWFRMDTERNADGNVVGILALHDDHNTVVIKGAPENVLSRCAGYEHGGKEYRMTDSARRKLLSACEEASRDNAYLVALASGITSEDNLRAPGAEARLIFRGFLAFRLTMEVNIPGAVYRCNRAGIETLVSTDDPYHTAASLGRSAGLIEHEGQMIHSREMAATDRGMFLLNQFRYRLFLDPTPDQWLDVLLLRKQAGRTVAAISADEEELPLLREADVSVAGVGASDAMRSGSDFLMAENGLHVLSNGITSARALCFRLKWLVQLLACGTFSLFLTLFLSLVIGTPVPFGVGELLLCGLIGNATVALAVCVLPVDRKLLFEPLPGARVRKNRKDLLLPLCYALGNTALLLTLPLLTHSNSATVVAFSLSQLLFACGCMREKGAFSGRTFGEKHLFLAGCALLAFLLLCLQVPFARNALGMSVLNRMGWLYALALPAAWQLLVQIGWFFIGRRAKKQSIPTEEKKQEVF